MPSVKSSRAAGDEHWLRGRGVSPGSGRSVLGHLSKEWAPVRIKNSFRPQKLTLPNYTWFVRLGPQNVQKSVMGHLRLTGEDAEVCEMSVICPNSCCEGRRRGPEPGAGVPELVLQAALLTLRRPLLTPGAVVSGEAAGGGGQSLREPRAAEQLAMSRTLMEPRATCGPARHRLVAQSLGPVGPGGGGMKPGLGLEVRE